MHELQQGLRITDEEESVLMVGPMMNGQQEPYSISTSGLSNVIDIYELYTNRDRTMYQVATSSEVVPNSRYTTEITGNLLLVPACVPYIISDGAQLEGEFDDRVLVALKINRGDLTRKH